MVNDISNDDCLLYQIKTCGSIKLWNVAVWKGINSTSTQQNVSKSQRASENPPDGDSHGVPCLLHLDRPQMATAESSQVSVTGLISLVLLIASHLALLWWFSQFCRSLAHLLPEGTRYLFFPGNTKHLRPLRNYMPTPGTNQSLWACEK